MNDPVTPADDATAGALVAAAQTDGDSADGILSKWEIGLADALDAPRRLAAAGVPAGDRVDVNELLAEAEALLNGRAAADGLLVCRPVMLEVADGNQGGLDTDANLLADLGLDSNQALPAGPHMVTAPMLGPLPADFLGLLASSLAHDLTALPTSGLQIDSIALQDGLQTEPLSDTLTEPSGDELPPGPGDELPPGPGDELPPGPGEDPITLPAQPVIVAFGATAGLSNVWTFDGTVQYSMPSTLTIVFGGLLQGHSTAVYLDGDFSYSALLPSGANGIVSAQAVGPSGELSEVVFEWIS